jgi:hypothetical protein
MCHAGSCESVNPNECIDYNTGKCTVVGGQCEIDPCIELDEEDCKQTFGCELLADGKCSVDECVKYGFSDCISSEEVNGCIVKGNKCGKGVCADLNEEECTIIPRCKLITEAMSAEKKCWTDICASDAAECKNENCVEIGGECLFDTCRTYNMDECLNDEECVYNNIVGCHKGTCSSLDVTSCKNLNGEKCVVVAGLCENGA